MHHAACIRFSRDVVVLYLYFWPRVKRSEPDNLVGAVIGSTGVPRRLAAGDLNGGHHTQGREIPSPAAAPLRVQPPLFPI